MIVKTRNGSFANQGYGGGTFNGNTAFGGLNGVRGKSRMRQHQYRDISNLNAPYDNMSLQGFGSLSGGPFGATASLSDLPVDGAEDYPWMEEAEPTFAIQREMNKSLTADGFGQLKVDGILGPRTCGALKHYGALDMVFGACDDYVSEFIMPKAADKMPANLPQEPQDDFDGGGGGNNAWLWGVLLAGGAVGLVLYMRKRRGKTVVLSSWG